MLRFTRALQGSLFLGDWVPRSNQSPLRVLSGPHIIRVRRQRIRLQNGVSVSKRLAIVRRRARGLTQPIHSRHALSTCALV